MVVLGGGGVAGIAWATGVIAGLARGGVDLSQADGFIGTSAGSVVGAQLACGETPESLLAAQLAPSPHSREMLRPYSQAAADEQNRKLVEKLGGDLKAARLRIGAFALRSETVAPEARREIIAARLPKMVGTSAHPTTDSERPAGWALVPTAWPRQWLGVVAVDVDTGDHQLFDRDSDVDFIDAIAASCAVPGAWPVVTIGAQRFMDGGIRSMTNADLAAGADQVVVLAPLGYSEGNPVSGHLRQEAAFLESAGATVSVIVPDTPSLEAMGDNVLDPARRAPSAQAGLEQGVALAPTLHFPPRRQP